MTASLAISPSSRVASPSLKPQRPKLSLNTTQPRSFGKGSSLRLETLSAVSPTIRNTFSNAYEAPQSAPTPAPTPARPRLSINSAVAAPSSSHSAPVTPTKQLETNTPDVGSTPSTGSAFSASSTESAIAPIPYKPSRTLSSILTNSPVPAADSPRKQRRPMFPAVKRVSFRSPLDEEIKTVKYIVAHSDIQLPDSASVAPSASEVSLSTSTDSSSTSDGTLLSPFEPGRPVPCSESAVDHADSVVPSSLTNDQSKSRIPRLPRPPRTGDKRDSSSDSDSDSCPETPVAGRRKRRREWVWTLGPIGQHSGNEINAGDDSS